MAVYDEVLCLAATAALEAQRQRLTRRTRQPQPPLSVPVDCPSQVRRVKRLQRKHLAAHSTVNQPRF